MAAEAREHFGYPRALSLSMTILLAVAGRVVAQQQKTPDEATKPLAKWIEKLKDERNWQVRLQARVALSPAGPYAKVAVPALIDAFKELPVSSESPLLSETAQTLDNYGPAIIPTLRKALTRPESNVRAGAAETLGGIRPRSVRVVPALIEAMKDPSPDVRSRAARSLGRIGPMASQAVPLLAAALHDEQAEVRAAAAGGLSKMPRQAQSAIGQLIRLLKDNDRQVCVAAAQALARIGPDAKAAVPGLIEGVRNKKYPGSRRALVNALAKIGSPAKDAVPALVEALQEQDQDFLSEEAALALGCIGPDSRAAVPALIKVLKAAKHDDVNSCPENAIFALGRIGPDAKAAVPFLIKALKNIRPEVGWAAIDALGSIGREAKAAIPALTAILQNQEMDADNRAFVAQALAKIDPKLAAARKLDVPTITVRLGRIPSVKLGPRSALSQERKKHIKTLIGKLADLEDPDFGLSSTVTGHAFAPLPGHYTLGTFHLSNQLLQTSHALRELVAAGPDALPFLLDALEDGTPTKLAVVRRNLMGIGGNLEGNPLNKWENPVISKPWPDEWDGQPDLYTVKVGDVCFVAIGQIVGRQYLAVSYVPTAIILINSPVQSDEMRERLRAVWSGKEPAKKHLDSLLIDYATEGIYNGESLDGWEDGSDKQIAAAMRLLYYFPQETAAMIATRMRSLDVRARAPDGWADREVKNGIRTIDFIKAVSWSKAPGIQEALADIARRTDDPDIKEALGMPKSR
jgi:HEAT repeat protein